MNDYDRVQESNRAARAMIEIGEVLTDSPIQFRLAGLVQWRITAREDRSILTPDLRALALRLFRLSEAEFVRGENLFYRLYPLHNPEHQNYNAVARHCRPKAARTIVLEVHRELNLRVEGQLATAAQVRVNNELDFFERFVATTHNRGNGTHRRMRRSEAARLFAANQIQRRTAPNSRPMNGRNNTRYQTGQP